MKRSALAKERVMFKKNFSLVIGLILMFNIFSLSLVVAEVGNEVAYIYKSKAAIDDNVVDVFESLGLEVDLIDERNIPDLSTYRFVYLGDERFRHEEDLMPWNYPTIVSNYFYGEDWGFTDRDGVSQLASSSPLSVKIGQRIVQVYTSAKYTNGVNLPYYYLAEGNKDKDFDKIAGTYIGNGDIIGDVISYGDAGIRLSNGEIANDDICFFGVIESDYWTDDAQDLFEECIEHVGVVCDRDSDCGDDELGETSCIGKDVYQEVEGFSCQDAGTVLSECVGNTDSVFKESCEVACVSGSCVCYDNDNDGYDNCNTGTPGDDGNPVDCNDNNANVNPGALEICDGIDNDCDGVVDEGSNICGAGNICSVGECVEVECSSNSDCGTDGFIDLTFCSQDDVYQNYATYTCENPGTISSSCSQDIEERLVTQCSDTCSSGACVDITCYNNLDCDDSNVYTKDSCKNPGDVTSFCEHESIACLQNSDCDDLNSYTEDTCNNPGSVNSFCSYEDIICFQGSDCGTDGFVNGFFCQADDVYQDYRTFGCDNPGTVSSFCTQTVEPVIINQCNDTCVAGACVDITCYEDNDCDDSNSDTIDTCLNPGTVNSQCTHEGIICSQNNDCGSDHFTGNLFCQGDDLYRNFVSFSCGNPATQQSFCSNNIDAQFIHSCTYACNDGSCVRCNNDLDCDDGKSNTVDSCNFAGSIDSYCSHDVGSTQCNNNIDDDNDNLVDAQDPGCWNDLSNPSTYNPNLDDESRSGVTCFNNFDCGIDIEIYPPYCEGNQVLSRSEVPTCNYPGTGTSFCSEEVVTDVEDVCTSNEVCLVDRCVSECVDNDNDGYDNCGFNQPDDDGNPVDCNDNNANVNPGALEICDGIDNDCDGLIDEGGNLCGLGGICNFGSCTNVECSTDLECGQDGFVGSNYCSVDNVYRNYIDYTCNNPGTANSNCVQDTESRLITQCSDTCSNGACVEIECENNNDCNDNNANTVDICISPGTVNSYCQNDPVECSSNSDCGTDGLNGDLFCENGDVSRKYITYTCSNPGTVFSSCSSSSSVTTVDACSSDEICVNAECVDSSCVEGNYIVSAYELDQKYDLFSNGNYILNWGGESEKWIRSLVLESVSDKEKWLFILPNGDIYLWDEDIGSRANIIGTSLKVAELDNVYYTDPSKLFDVLINSAERLDELYGLYTDGDYQTNWGRQNEKWVRSLALEDAFNQNEKWLFILPNGEAYRWDENVGSRNNIIGTSLKVAELDSSYYNNPETLFGLVGSRQCLNVACFNNNDCGANGFTGSNFCSDEETVGRNYRTYSCSNPGTEFSVCSSSVEERDVEQCSSDEICDGGACKNDEEGNWYPTYSRSCNRVCSDLGLTSMKNDLGQECTSGETNIRDAIDELGTSIYVHGCWNVACDDTATLDLHDTRTTDSIGSYCYQPVNKKDNDNTDLTVACFCG